MRINLLGEVKEVVDKNIPKAQYILDNQIMNDVIPYMPIQTGTFQNITRMRSASLAGTGEVCVATGIYGRYLYYGKVMVDSQTGKGARPIRLPSGELIFRHRKGAKLVASGKNLKYSNPNATAEWYETAKEANYTKWQELVRKVLINGG